jgi:hypothetical protein
MSFCLQQSCMALARHSTLPRHLQLARSAQRSSRASLATASTQANHSTAAMDLQSSVSHEQLVNALRDMVPTLDSEFVTTADAIYL